MRFRTNISILLLLFVAAACAPSQQTSQMQTQLSAEQQHEINEIISQMPAADEEEQVWLNERLMKTAPASVHQLAGKLGAPGTGDDTPARYAINGLAKYVSRPGNEPQRSTYEDALISQLESDQPPAVKIFLMEQLELVGSDASVAVLGSFLGDEFLNSPAAQALRSINTSMARSTLLQALDSTEGNVQIAVIKALGDTEISSAEAVAAIQPFTESKEPKFRETALYALANTGHPQAMEVISSQGSEQQKLQFARRLAEEGNNQQATQMAQGVYEASANTHEQINALQLLVSGDSDGSRELLLNAATDENKELRSAALELIRNMESDELAGQLAGQLDRYNPAVKADIIHMLGERGERSAWSVVRSNIGNSNLSVRLAAIVASVPLGENRAVSPLISRLDQATAAEEINAIQTALLQLPSQSIYQSASQQWMSMSNSAKVALIEIVAQRRTNQYLGDLLNEFNSSSSEVRLAVLRALPNLARTDDLRRLTGLFSQTSDQQETDLLKAAITNIVNGADEKEATVEQLISYMNNGSADRRVLLIQMLPEIGGERALEQIMIATENSSTQLRDVALHSLASWNESSAIPHLQQAIQSADSKHRPALASGYIQLVRTSLYSDADKVKFLTSIMDDIQDSESRSSLIAALADIESPESLRALSNFLEDQNEEIRREAMNAMAEVLASSYDFGSNNDAADKVLGVIEAKTDSTTRSQIEQKITDLQQQEQSSEGFASLFNGQNLNGWTGATDAYVVRGEQLIHQDGESGNLFTQQEYGDFILRFDFKLTPGANNGLAIRSPMEGDPAYQGMELQILDNSAEEYSDLEPYQYHGSVYGVAPAQRGHLKPAGEWNSQEVIANGSQITVKLNGVTILETDLEEAAQNGTMDGRDHPGLFRPSGHIGFLGHGDEVAFRNIRIRDLNVYYPDYSMGGDEGGGMNHPPEGFQALFNGENLEGWKGLVANPEERAEMSAQELNEAQQEADRIMQQHWSVQDGILFFDGQGESLTTQKDYKDFEMLLDFKIEPGGDSGVYLRGTPQVQIWDPTQWPQGSGGLYNNQENLSEPLVRADNPVGEWNNMQIKMIGEEVTVHLNGHLVVPGIVLENYWNREKPIYDEGQIELQAHNTPLYFKNVFIREIPRTMPLFNSKDLSGWEAVGANAESWSVENDLLVTSGEGMTWEQGSGGGWLSTDQMYDNFTLELEYRLPEGGNSGVFLRAPREGDPAYQGLEIQLLDDQAEQYQGLNPWQYTASIYGIKAPSAGPDQPAGEWHKLQITANGPEIKVRLNGELIVDTNLIHHLEKVSEHPGLKRRNGYIGLQNHNSRVEFRNIRITEIK